MANAEVSIPVGDVVVVPTEGTEGGNPEDTKTQVILQLQPVQQGRIYQEGSETNAAVMAVETHTIHKLEDGIDASALESNEEIEIAYPITCGDSKAILLWKKFVCPGINVKCVKFNDQLISPKHFVHLAGKSTLKDWKRAIRLGGIMLRTLVNICECLPVDAAVLNNVAHTFGLMDTVKRVLDNRKSQTDQGEEQFLNTLEALDHQLEEQKKFARSPSIQNVVLMPVNTPKPPKRPRLKRPASATVLSPSAPIQQPQFTVISPITIAPMGQQFSLSNIPMATISQGSSPVTVHTLPSGSQLFRYATVVSSSKTSTSDTVTLHPSSSLALLSSAAMQDSGTLANVATVVNPVELVAMESGLTSTIQAVEGTSEDGQTIIEIDPAPDPEADPEESGGKAVILGTELRTEEKVVAEVDEHQHQVHNVEIVVLED
ncbi:glucocorticoid modulatory element-binding protein 1 [Notechis scutatus]|uniref:Glucocorticoid modulatory element-binding protein 1 n=1 Tax=Notechis scutatus TaxID=8663 RepID=A0A6J1UWB2_9SAUR|nr:glucocorticoid modulatory element-binding protein 1 [Notechis scutatus]